MTDLNKGARILDADRDKLAAELRKCYEKGTAIRDLAQSIVRSYGFVHRILAESGVTLRDCGGANNRKGKGAKRSAKG